MARRVGRANSHEAVTTRRGGCFYVRGRQRRKNNRDQDGRPAATSQGRETIFLFLFVELLGLLCCAAQLPQLNCIVIGLLAGWS